MEKAYWTVSKAREKARLPCSSTREVVPACAGREHILLEYLEEEVVLDAMLLDEKVLGNILGVEDVRTDQ